MTKTTEISLAQARKLALNCQHLPLSRFRRGRNGVLDAVTQLGYVQIDTISVVNRAHHITLWNRVPHYRLRYVDELIRSRSLLEYWSHAAAYLPMQDFRFCLPRMQAIAAGQRHWYRKNPKLMKEVLERVRFEGPLQARDFESHAGSYGGMWEWGPVKQAIEHLFHEGELLVTRRDNFQKVFDLTERVVPEGVDTRMPSHLEYAHYLIDCYLRAHGFGQPSEFSYLRKGMGVWVKQAIEEKVESGAAVPIKIKGCNGNFIARHNFESILTNRLARNRARILCPFDNLIIQRKRIQQLFDFDYQLECYLPADKRRFGYFSLPVLWQGCLTARLDAKAMRQDKVMQVHQVHVEPGLRSVGDFFEQLSIELKRFAEFHDCHEIRTAEGCPPQLRNIIRSI